MVERKYTDLVGQKFNRLTVIAFSRREKNVDYWLCQCDCGEEKVVSRYELTSGGTKSCGCIRIKDLTGQRFGRWTVLSFSHKDKNRASCWLCKCDCGKEKIVMGSNLQNGTSQSCGCYNKERIQETHFIDLVGQRFNRLLVIEFSHKNKYEKSCWLCRCDCGKEITVIGSQLTNGNTKSCGCYQRQRVKETNSGKNHWNWKDGSSKEPYPSEWTSELKELIRNRDNRKCQFRDCNYDDTKEKTKLSVHHIDGNKQNCEEWNLISLCVNHHIEIERNNPELWQEFFYAITNDYR